MEDEKLQFKVVLLGEGALMSMRSATLIKLELTMRCGAAQAALERRH